MARDLKLEVLLQAIDRATGPLKKISRSSGDTADALKQTRDKLKNLKRAQADLSSFKSLKRASQDNARALGEQEKKVAELSRAIKNTTGPTKQLNRQRKAAIREASRLKQKTSAQQHELEQLRRSLSRAKGGSSSLSQQQKTLAREISKTNKQLDRQQNALRKVAHREKKLSHIRAAQQNNRDQRADMRGRLFETVAIGAAAALPVKTAVEFESTMADLNKVANLTPKRLQAVREQILDMSRQMPMAADQIGAIMTAAAQAGIAKNEIVGFTRDAIKMGIAMDITGDEAGTMMAKWRTGMRLTQPQVKTLADATNYLSNNMAATAPEIADVVTRVGAYAKTAGIGQLKTAALAASMIAAGGAPEKVATAVKRMASNLTAGASATKTQSEAMETLGFTATGMAGRMQKDAAGTIELVFERIKKLNKAEQPAVIKQLFGQESVGVIAPLLGNLDQLKTAIGSVSDKTKFAGSMQKEYESRVKTTANDLQLLKNKFAALAISLGSILLPALSALAGAIGTVVDKVSQIAKEFPTATKFIVGAAVALIGLKVAAFAGGYGFALLKGGLLAGIKVLTHLRSALTLVAGGLRIVAVAATANPIGAAIVVLIGAAILIYKYWGPIKRFFIGLWQQVKDAFDGGIAGVAKLLINWSPLGLVYKGLMAGLKALGIELPEKFASLGGMIVDGIISGLKSAPGKLKNAVVGLGGKVTGWFKAKLGIHSPSRVFAELGVNTVQGYELGLKRQQASALQNVNRFARRIRGAGAGLAIGTAALPALATPLQFDHRPPISAARSGAPAQINLGDITINAAPGMDEQALAQYVAAEVQRALTQAKIDAGAARRSALYDTD